MIVDDQDGVNHFHSPTTNEPSISLLSLCTRQQEFIGIKSVRTWSDLLLGFFCVLFLLRHGWWQLVYSRKRSSLQVNFAFQPSMNQKIALRKFNSYQLLCRAVEDWNFYRENTHRYFQFNRKSLPSVIAYVFVIPCFFYMISKDNGCVGKISSHSFLFLRGLLLTVQQSINCHQRGSLDKPMRMDSIINYH
jgi:hypothetical protein